MQSMTKLRSVLAVAAACAAMPAMAQISDAGVKIGVMNDMSGTYADLSGRGSVVAAQIAAEEFGNKVKGKPITIVFADHQNKADVAASTARKWFDVDGVNMVVDFPNSSTALAVQEVAKEKKRINMVSTGATTALTGKQCSPYGFHWTYDTYSNSVALVKALAARKFDTWYFITADYAFGHALEADFRKALESAGLKTVGATKHPLNAPDMSSPVVSAQGSKAKAVVLANAGNDMINGVKAAGDFGLTKSGQALIAPVTFITDIKSLGLRSAQGLMYIDAFYWDMDDRTRAFAKKFYDKHKAMPTMGQAGVYSATRAYLKAVEAADSTDADKVAQKLRELPVDDAMTRNGKVRADGRLVKDMYLTQIKTPGESKGEWDLQKIVATIPGDQAFRPLAESDCPLVKK